MGKKLYTKNDTSRIVPASGTADAAERYRTPWRRDFARLIHSAAFRRLQGKTQLFPSHESDFFRNRLTHSLEVAQVAKSIAIRLNATHSEFKNSNAINTDLVETAALAHDLGHPPFGHNGEEALDECMWEYGGFEGNAQTLRILSKLEKRQTKLYENDEPQQTGPDGTDQRVGLNLTFRTLAAVLKYDREIPRLKQQRDASGPVKGYYYTEADVVAQVKKHVGAESGREFKTIECSIMDVADDIAYSTYDLEDAFKANFVTPLAMLSAPSDLIVDVAETISKRIKRYYPSLDVEKQKIDPREVYQILVAIFSEMYQISDDIAAQLKNGTLSTSAAAAQISSEIAAKSKKTAADGYFRTKFTSELVGRFIQGVKVDIHPTRLPLSRAYLEIETFKKVEVLKNFTFQALIMSSMLKVAEHRGKDIVKAIFKAIDDGENGHLLMPDDFRSLWNKLKEPDEKRRVICDFIAGMTDRYAIQFYGRLFGTNPESIYSPL